MGNYTRRVRFPYSRGVSGKFATYAIEKRSTADRFIGTRSLQKQTVDRSWDEVIDLRDVADIRFVEFVQKAIDIN